MGSSILAWECKTARRSSCADPFAGIVPGNLISCNIVLPQCKLHEARRNATLPDTHWDILIKFAFVDCRGHEKNRKPKTAFARNQGSGAPGVSNISWCTGRKPQGNLLRVIKNREWTTSLTMSDRMRKQAAICLQQSQARQDSSNVQGNCFIG